MGYNLTQINPAYELVSDIVVGTATTSVDFNWLSIGKEDDYMLVMNNLTGTSGGLLVYVNGNTTDTNYWTQLLYADSTTVSSVRSNYSRIGAVDGFGIAKLKLTNNGYFVSQSNGTGLVGLSSTQIVNYYSTSTFTMTSITSLRIASSVANQIKAGARFQLYKRVAPIVYDYTVSSAMTSLDITGLDITKDSEYMLVSDIKNTASYSNYVIYSNNNYTDTNYYSQTLYATGTTVNSARYNFPFLTGLTSGYLNFAIINIKLTNNGYTIFQANNSRQYAPNTQEMYTSYITSTNISTSITSLRISAITANGIGIGSRFQLIKLK